MAEEKKVPAKGAKKGNFWVRKFGAIGKFFRDTKSELKKVVWPTKKELGSFTAVVLATCAAFALVFWAVDTGVLAAIKAVCF